MEGLPYSVEELGLNPNVVVPPLLVVGDAWSFQCVIGQYDNWTGLMTFAAGTSRLSVAATTDGEYFTWLFAGADTATLTAQPYLWTRQMTDPGGNRYTVQSGGTQVVGDISVTPPLQTQTSLQQMLAACDATLMKLLSQEAQIVAYAGQTYTMHNVKDLFGIRCNLANRVVQEMEMLSGNTRSSRILPRFVFR